jgi:mono/diheme cytochrome c family protein
LNTNDASTERAVGLASTVENPGPSRTPLKGSLGLLALGVVVLGLSALAARTIRGRVEARPPAASLEVVAAPVAPSSLAKRGKLLFQVQCSRCHGPDGHGDGPDAANLQPAPRDFASANWRFGSSPESIRKVVVEGIAGTSMYPLGGSLSGRELDAVVEHVRSLAPKDREAEPANRPAPEVVAALKAAGFVAESPSRTAPSVVVEDYEGSSRSLEFGQAKLTLLVFWGTSCAPCQEELPELEHLATDFQGQGLKVVPVCVDEADRARVRRVVRGKFDRFPSFVSVDGMARLHYDIQTLPVAALIDREGNLLGIARGGIDWRSVEARRLIAGGLADKH